MAKRKGKEQYTATAIIDEGGKSPMSGITMTFPFGQEISKQDMSEAKRASQAWSEICDAGFSFEEEGELIKEVLVEKSQTVRAIAAIMRFQTIGKPYEIENPKGELFHLKMEGRFIKQYPVKKAQFGVRPPDHEDAITLKVGEPPPWLDDPREKEAWSQSPSVVATAGVHRGDPRWIRYLKDIEDSKRKEDDEEAATLSNFFSLQDWPRDPNGTIDIVKNTQSHAWTLLRKARVFHIPAPVFSEIYRMTDIYCTESLCGLDFIAPQLESGKVMYPRQASQEESDRLLAALKKASPSAPMPRHFPFETMFIGLGSGIKLTKEQALSKILMHESTLHSDSIGDFETLCVLGILISSSGHVYECYSYGYENWGEAFLSLPIRKPEEGFISTFDLSPWYSSRLVDFIVEHKTYVHEKDMGSGQKSRARKVRRAKRGLQRSQGLYMPPPYYRVRMQDKVIRQSTRSIFPSKPNPRSYRTDVIGHHRLYVRRGKLPIAADKKSVLEKRGYTVFEHTRPSEKLMNSMALKGHERKMPHEWIAIRQIWIEEHQTSSDMTLPYIPSMRTKRV